MTTERISRIVFKYPQLMSKEAESIIRLEYQNILFVKDQLHKAEEKVLELQEKLRLKEEEFNKKSVLFDIEFQDEVVAP